MADKIAIIGSNAFLASRIIKKLKLQLEDCQIIGFSRTNKSSISLHEWILFDYPKSPVDLRNLLTTKAIIYCVGAGIQSNLEVATNDIYELNAFYPIQIFNYLETNNYKGLLITFGSYFEIGNNLNDQTFSEEEVVLSNLDTPNHYCLSKRLLSRFLFKKRTTINYYHLILPTIYGQGENLNRLIPYLLKCIQDDIIPKVTSGTQIRQYIHAADIAKLINLLISQKAHTSGIYNVKSADTLSVKELIERILSYKNATLELALGDANRKDIKMKFISLNTTKINAYLPEWSPVITLEKGILNY